MTWATLSNQAYRSSNKAMHADGGCAAAGDRPNRWRDVTPLP